MNDHSEGLTQLKFGQILAKGYAFAVILFSLWGISLRTFGLGFSGADMFSASAALMLCWLRTDPDFDCRFGAEDRDCPRMAGCLRRHDPRARVVCGCRLPKHRLQSPVHHQCHGFGGVAGVSRGFCRDHSVGKPPGSPSCRTGRGAESRGLTPPRERRSLASGFPCYERFRQLQLLARLEEILLRFA